MDLKKGGRASRKSGEKQKRLQAKSAYFGESMV